MSRSCKAAALVCSAALMAIVPTPGAAQDAPSLAGRWTLNRELSGFPRDIGFNPDWIGKAGAVGTESATGGSPGGGPGGPPTGGRTAYPVSRVSREDAMLTGQLTDEAREPAATLVITEAADSVTIAADKGAARTFRTNGRDQVQQLGEVTVATIATREAGRLVVRYKVDPTREVRYTYSRTASPAQLVVEAQFLERGKGGSVKRVYEPDQGTSTPAAATRPGATPAPSQAAPPRPPAGPPPATPAAPSGAERLAFDQSPDAQFKGLTTLGVVIEGLGPQAATCGLRADAIQSAVTKQLSSAGLKVSPNTAEDTYVYVNVQTATMAGGLCISRFDAFLSTHTTAPLEYHPAPVLVDVTLMHKGGLAAGAAAAHADMLMKGLQDYVGQFTARIRDANK